MVLGNQRFDRRFAERPEARVRVRLVGGHEPAVPGHLGGEKRRQFPLHRVDPNPGAARL
jgi:hypothetical protein